MTGQDAIIAAPSRAGRLRPLGGLLAAMAVALTGTRVSAIALPCASHSGVPGSWISMMPAASSRASSAALKLPSGMSPCITSLP